MEKNKPIATIKHGAVRAAIWKNDSKNGPFLNLTFSRTYKDGDAFKDASSYGREDVKNLLCACVEALHLMEQPYEAD